jgi:hypothetical protein
VFGLLALSGVEGLALSGVEGLALSGVEGLNPFTVFDPHVRSEAPELRALVREGVERSATLARLVDRLQASDVVAYVEYGYSMAHDEDGSVSFLSAAGGRRYLRVLIRWDLLRKQQLAILGHELRHALEIAEALQVVDASSLATLYRRIGKEVARHPHRCFDTDAAVEAGRQVMREVMDRHSGNSLQRRHTALPGTSPAEGIQ